MTREIERELLNAERPDPLPALRQRVLAMANPLVQPNQSRLDAIWFSPRSRLAAVLLFVGLIAVDALSSEIGGLPQQVDNPRIISSVELAVQAAVEAGLGKADVAAIAAQAASPPWTDEADGTRGGRMELTGALND